MSINAKELRIGNWVKRRDKFLLVESIGIVIIRLSHNGLPSDYPIQLDEQLEYIPLTTEILLKCGFEKDERTTCIYAHSEFDTIIRYPDGLIDYVHQLQNLYFALNKKELEINLTL